jgi:hypothetical protein
MTQTEAIAQALLINELSGNRDAAYRFSKASENSGYSFGVCQWDVGHNLEAATILKACGFSQMEIAWLEKGSLPNRFEYAQRLLAAKTVIDAADLNEFQSIVAWVKDVLASNILSVADLETFTHLADYHNQFHLDMHGECEQHLKSLNRLITAQDILTFKLDTKWGKIDPEDVKRRWNNIHGMFAGG